jgi:hypothetical protein
MEAGVFGSIEEEASYGIVILLSQVNEVLAILFFSVCIVDDHALPIFDLPFSNFVAFFFGFECIAIHTRIIW